MRACRWPGCRVLLPSGSAYCGQHQPKRDRLRAERDIAYDLHQRDPEAVRFYRSAAWLAARTQVIAAEPICRMCKREFASVVDHIVPRTECADPLAIENLQPLCSRCHGRKTRREAAAKTTATR